MSRPNQLDEETPPTTARDVLGSTFLPDYSTGSLEAMLQRAANFTCGAERMEFDAEAEAAWEAISLPPKAECDAFLETLEEPYSTYVLRIASIVALLDRSRKIAVHHLRNSLVICGRFMQSDSMTVPALRASTTSIEERILKMVQPGGAVTRSEITKQLSHRARADEIADALDALSARGEGQVIETPTMARVGRPGQTFRRYSKAERDAWLAGKREAGGAE